MESSLIPSGFHLDGRPHLRFGPMHLLTLMLKLNTLELFMFRKGRLTTSVRFNLLD